MESSEKSREELLAEIVALKNEICKWKEYAEKSMVPSEKDFCSMLITTVPEYLYSVELVNNTISSIYHSPQCRDITGYAPQDYIDNPTLWLEMIHENDRERVLAFLHDLREPLNCKSIEHRIFHKDKSIRWILNMSTVHIEAATATLRQSGFIIDVSGRKEVEEHNLLLLEKTRKDSFTDDLTQLYNRRAFKALAEQQVRVAERINHEVLLFFVDVDKLKYVNDTFGHVMGDRYLMEMAKILRTTFRESDIIARIGGDEFAVLSMETGPNSSEMLVERLQTNLDLFNRENKSVFGLSASAGIARCEQEESNTISALLDRADQDMYARKRNKSIVQ